MKDKSPPVTPHEFPTLLLSTVFLALDDVTDRAPIRQQSIQHRARSVRGALPNQGKDAAQPRDGVRGVLIHIRRAHSLDQGGSEELKGLATKMPYSRQLLRGVSAPKESLGLRSEEHTSELQSRRDLVCRLLLEKK